MFFVVCQFHGWVSACSACLWIPAQEGADVLRQGPGEPGETIPRYPGRVSDCRINIRPLQIDYIDQAINLMWPKDQILSRIYMLSAS